MLIIKQSTALKLIKEIIKAKTLPKDVNIILSGISFNQAATNVSALANTNGGLIIYELTNEAKNVDSMLKKVIEERE